MRKILFRAKHINDGSAMSNQWVYGDLCHFKDGLPFIRQYETGCCYEIVPETVGQFTGLFDKNGKEIYEGDILGFSTKRKMGYQKDGVEITLSVVFGRHNPNCDTLSEYMGFWVESGFRTRGSIAYEVESHGAKVIGNIYDNPELVELK